MPSRVLIVDDEPTILATMAPLLRVARLRGVHGDVRAGLPGERRARRAPISIILDLGLPDMDGVEVCRLLRDGRATPIIVLSARGAEADKVGALDAGADDYVTKPFGAEELLARIRVALRRIEPSPASAGPIVRGDLVIDRDRHRVTRGGEEIRLTPKEFELLVFLAQHPGRVLTHRAILKAIWGPHAVDQPEHLRVLLGSLRKKIEPDPVAPALHRDRAVGRLSVRAIAADSAASSARFSISTLTRGSPRNPELRGLGQLRRRARAPRLVRRRARAATRGT